MRPVLLESHQHIGQRSQQQDAVQTFDALPGFDAGTVAAVVADGMGGMVGGAEASRVAVEAFEHHVARRTPEEPADAVLHRALAAAGMAVVQAARAQHASGEMGTTFVAALVEHGRLVWRTVGDSRLYLFRAGRLQQLNTEHTLAQRLRRSVDAGLLSLDEALAHPEARALTSFLGQEKVAEVDGPAAPVPLQVGDRIVLCSDGLHGTLSDDEIVRRLAELAPGQTARALVDDTVARQKPHQDNVSVAVLTVVAAEVGAAAAPEPGVTVVRPAAESVTEQVLERTMPAAPVPAAAAPSKSRAPWVLAGALAVVGVGGYAAWQSLNDPPTAATALLSDSTRGDTTRPGRLRDSLSADSLGADSLGPARTGTPMLEAVPARRDSGAGPSPSVYPPPVTRRAPVAKQPDSVRRE